MAIRSAHQQVYGILDQGMYGLRVPTIAGKMLFASFCGWTLDSSFLVGERFWLMVRRLSRHWHRCIPIGADVTSNTASRSRVQVSRVLLDYALFYKVFRQRLTVWVFKSHDHVLSWRPLHFHWFHKGSRFWLMESQSLNRLDGKLMSLILLVFTRVLARYSPGESLEFWFCLSSRCFRRIMVNCV